MAFTANGPKFRVLYDSSSPYGIEIISDKNLGDAVELGRNDVAGEGKTEAGLTNLKMVNCND